MERELRRARKRTRFIVLILLGVGLVVGGFIMLFVSTFPEGRELDQEVFQGVAPSGSTVVPINRTDFGWVEITGEVIPCGLSIHALTAVQVEIFNETRVVPQGSIGCETRTALIRAAATHVVVLNEDATSSLGYQVRATYFSVSQPFAWLLFPAIGLLGGGLLLTGVVLIRRD